MPSPTPADRAPSHRLAPEPGPIAGLGLVLLDLVVPQECAGCGIGGSIWCRACARAAQAGPRVRLAGPRPTVAWGAHAGGLARAVVAFKDGGQRRLATPLGRMLAGSVIEVLGGHGAAAGQRVWLVPVPSRPAARRRRGVDHTAVLAGRAARELRREGVAADRLRLLRRVGAHRDQVGLDRAGRAANAAGTIRAGTAPAGVIVIVDDVTTTGATLSEARRAIRVAEPAGRARVVLAATITAAVTHPSGARGLRGLAWSQVDVSRGH